jgi:hypothetical protein
VIFPERLTPSSAGVLQIDTTMKKFSDASALLAAGLSYRATELPRLNKFVGHPTSGCALVIWLGCTKFAKAGHSVGLLRHMRGTNQAEKMLC